MSDFKKIAILLFVFMVHLCANAQNFAELMQNGRIHYNKQNYLSAFEQFTMAQQLAKSELEIKDAETWKSNSFKNLQKQHQEMENTIRSDKMELKKAKNMLETIYFYERKIALAFKDNKFGFIDKNGNTKIPFIYDQATEFEPSTGFAKAWRDKTQYLIDTTGNEFNLASSISAINANTMSVDLRNQNLSEFPPTLFTYSNIQILLIAQNKIQRIPKEISKLKNLVFIDLSQNGCQLLPDEFCQLTKLEQINMSDNQIARLPDNFQQLQNLVSLNAENNNLFILPPGFGNLHSLVKLNLKGNKLKNLPEEFGKLNQLNFFSAQNNQIEKLPAEFANLDNIQEIDLSNNSIYDIPPSFERLKSLKKLNISKNKIGNIPVELKKMSNMLEFDLRGNRIPEDKKGMIKSWFPNCLVHI